MVKREFFLFYFVLLVFCDCYLSVDLPHGVVSWFAVCGCVIFWSYSFAVFLKIHEADCFTMFVLLVFCDCYCSVALPHGWSAVCGCVISWSYSLYCWKYMRLTALLCLPGVLWLLLFCCSSPLCRRLVCSVWLSYFLIILIAQKYMCFIHTCDTVEEQEMHK